MGGQNNSETLKKYYRNNRTKIREIEKRRYREDAAYRTASKIRTREWYEANKKAANAYGRMWYQKNKPKVLENCRQRHLEILELAAGRPKPKICEVPGCGRRNKIVFDHAHYTEKFRGWICDGCNKALGAVLDNPKILSNLSKYVRDYDAKNNCVRLRNNYYATERKVQRLQSLQSYKSARKCRMDIIKRQNNLPN